MPQVKVAQPGTSLGHRIHFRQSLKSSLILGGGMKLVTYQMVSGNNQPSQDNDSGWK